MIPCFIIQGLSYLILLKLGKSKNCQWLNFYFAFWNNQKNNKTNTQLASGRLMTEKESNNIFAIMLWTKNNKLLSVRQNVSEISFVVNTKLKKKQQPFRV
jgi:hypothetical protein